jgi:hypothetical protein
MGAYIPTDNSYKKEFKGGFEAYLSSGLNKLGDPVTTKQQYKIVGSGAGRIRPVVSGTVNRNAKPVGKRKTGDGTFYQGGKNHGMTRGQVIEKARGYYASKPDSWKKKWEDVARGSDIRSEKEKASLSGKGSSVNLGAKTQYTKKYKSNNNDSNDEMEAIVVNEDGASGTSSFTKKYNK